MEKETFPVSGTGQRWVPSGSDAGIITCCREVDQWCPPSMSNRLAVHIYTRYIYTLCHLLVCCVRPLSDSSVSVVTETTLFIVLRQKCHSTCHLSWRRHLQGDSRVTDWTMTAETLGLVGYSTPTPTYSSASDKRSPG